MSERFRLEARPAVVVRNLQKVSFAATRLRTEQFGHGNTLPIPPEDTIVAILQLRDLHDHDLSMRGKSLGLQSFRAGTFSAVDLANDPIAYLGAPFDLIQMYLPRQVFHAIADDIGAPRIGELNLRPGQTYDDPVVRHLCLALLPALENPQEANQLFVDHLAMAIHLHLARTYGGMRVPPPAKGGLAVWQLRRAKELLRENLDGEMALRAVAAACDLSLSHFTRAFKRSTGEPPHRWILGRRVDLAKSMLRISGLPLGSIAAACGFADQSHFTRIFRRYTGSSPGAWRRERLSHDHPGR